MFHKESYTQSEIKYIRQHTTVFGIEELYNHFPPTKLKQWREPESMGQQKNVWLQGPEFNTQHLIKDKF